MSTQRWISSTDGAVPFGLEPPFAESATPDAVNAIVSELEAGADWEEGFGRLWHLLAGHPRPVLPPPDGGVNWTWLTDLDELHSAVDLASPFGEVADTLALEFPQVRYVGADTVHGRAVARRMASHGRQAVIDAFDAADASHNCDLVVFAAAAGWRERLPTGMTLRDVPSYGRGLLKPGGWLAVLARNPLWYWRYRRPRDVPSAIQDFRLVRTLRRGLRHAGFTDIREYLTVSVIGIPVVFVPRRQSAVIALHRAKRISDYRDRLARCGMYAPLFPTVLLLARQ